MTKAKAAKAHHPKRAAPSPAPRSPIPSAKRDQSSTLRIIRLCCFILLALIVGFFAITLVFSDLGPGETMTTRTMTMIVFYAILGLVIGYFNPSSWWIAGLSAWGIALFGLLGFLGTRNPLALSLLLVLAWALAAGYCGSRLRKKWDVFRHLGE